MPQIAEKENMSKHQSNTLEHGMFRKQDLKKLIIPLMIEQTLALTVGMFDTLMVASAGESAVSGVSLVETINVLIINLLTALATGGAIVAGQYLGSKDRENSSKAGKQLILVTFAMSILLMVFCLILNEQLLSIFFGNIDSKVMSSARTYFYITSLSYPFLAIYNSAAALFRGMGSAKVAMVNSLIMNVINVGGNAVLIYGLGWGVFGAACASTVSRIVAATTMIIMLRNPNLALSVRSYSFRDLDFTMIKRILRIGIPNGLEGSVFQIGRIIMTSLVAVYGTTAIAAHAVGTSLTGVEVIPGQALGLAMTTVVAQCVGAKEFKQANEYIKYLLKISWIYMIILNVVMMALMFPMLGIYNLSEETFSLAFKIMLVHGIGCMTIWPASFTLPNAFRAAGDVKYPMIISIFSMWVFRIGCSYLLAYVFNLGAISVWIAMLVDWAFRSSCFLVRWKSGKWKNNAII